MTVTNNFLPLTKTITPVDSADVAGAVRDACRDGTPVYPIGGGTSLDYGLRPSVPGIGISLAELNRAVDHAVHDMTITVGTGITIAELARRLADERQRLPVDVRQADRATLGGVVATNLVGPRRYAYGTMRDYVIGIQAVDGRGTLFSGGGRVVKNAAGYNLCRLLVGSLGTLGVITQVTLMVRPMPETTALAVCEAPDFDAAERLLAALIHTRTLPAAIELQAGPGRQDNPAIGPMLQSSVARVFVGFEGSQAEVEWMIGKLRDEWRDAGVSSPVTISPTEAGLAWDWLSEFPTEVQVGVLPGATVDMIARLLRVDPTCSIQAHAGNGVIGVCFSPREPADFVTLLRDGLRPAVAVAGGKMVVLSNPDGAELTCHETWGPPGDGATVMRAIKDRFDPQGLLNPGRFVF